MSVSLIQSLTRRCTVHREISHIRLPEVCASKIDTAKIRFDEFDISEVYVVQNRVGERDVALAVCSKRRVSERDEALAVGSKLFENRESAVRDFHRRLCSALTIGHSDPLVDMYAVEFDAVGGHHRDPSIAASAAALTVAL